jgi:lipoprotein-anchoring transpeptidase ErfK/SrfK
MVKSCRGKRCECGIWDQATYSGVVIFSIGRAAVVGVLLIGLGVTPVSAVTVGSVGVAPATPVVTGVTGGSVSGEVTISFEADPAASGYEVSRNSGVTWESCGVPPEGCLVTGLTNGSPTAVLVRAVREGAVSAVASVTVTATAPAPRLPRPRVWTSVSFNAASNGLGVNGSTAKLGVGTLPELRFSRPITDKAAVERGLTVTATTKGREPRTVPGSWGWLDDRRVVFRPMKWWPEHSVIIIRSELGHQVLGRSGGKYVVGRKNLDAAYTFRTGRKLIATVDGRTKMMTVRIDGEVKHRFPVSLGKPGWETRNGPKIIYNAKEPFKIYTSQAIGIMDPAQAYALPAKWNTRLTPTGEYIHTATWAYGRLGRANGSHGCTNMREEHAKWIFDNTVPGDVIDFRNTGGGTVESWNGPGGLWNIPWDRWLKKSALRSPAGKPDTSRDPGSVASTPPVGA